MDSFSEVNMDISYNKLWKLLIDKSSNSGVILHHVVCAVDSSNPRDRYDERPLETHDR